ncbi:MAG: hypothetical protein JWN50_239, partial [Parcubacteria group bacterium]|nr:hypothetical protein [Parcubacteria group bacterium]
CAGWFYRSILLNKKILISVGVLLVCVLAGIGLLVRMHASPAASPASSAQANKVDSNVVYKAAGGKLASNTLKSFIVRDDAVILDSAIISTLYNGVTKKVYTVQYSANADGAVLHDAYAAALKAMGYTIAQTEPDATGETIFAGSGAKNQSVVIGIHKSTAGSTIDVSLNEFAQ